MLVRVIATAIMFAGVAGCATSRDIRKLQVQIDDLRAGQQTLQAQLARIDSVNATEVSGTRELAVDLKSSLSEFTDRLDQIDARLMDLDQRVARPRAAGPSTPQVIMQPSGQGEDSPMQPVESPVRADRQATYQAAYEAMGQEEYDRAIMLFREYVAVDPGGEESGAALYWIGECFAASGQPDSAIAEFQMIVDMHAESDKVPAALFRIGNLYEEQGDKKSAFPYYQRLRNEFPQSLEYQLLRKKLGE